VYTTSLFTGISSTKNTNRGEKRSKRRSYSQPWPKKKEPMGPPLKRRDRNTSQHKKQKIPLKSGKGGVNHSRQSTKRGKAGKLLEKKRRENFSSAEKKSDYKGTRQKWVGAGPSFEKRGGIREKHYTQKPVQRKASKKEGINLTIRSAEKKLTKGGVVDMPKSDEGA